MINFALNIQEDDKIDDDDVPNLEEETADDDAAGTRMEDID